MDPKKLNSYVGVVNQPPPKWSTMGRLKKVDDVAGTLKLADETTIPLNEIVDLQCNLFQGLV